MLYHVISSSYLNMCIFYAHKGTYRLDIGDNHSRMGNMAINVRRLTKISDLISLSFSE